MVSHTTPTPSNKELLYHQNPPPSWGLIRPLDTWAFPPTLFTIHMYACTHVYNNWLQLKIKYLIYSKCKVWLFQVEDLTKFLLFFLLGHPVFKSQAASFDFIFLDPHLSEHCLANEVRQKRRSWNGIADILKEQRHIFSTAPSHTFSTASIKWHALYENDTCHLFLSTSQNTVIFYINL